MIRLDEILLDLKSHGIYVDSTYRIIDGLNSSVYKLQGGEEKWALKIYPCKEIDLRERLRNELLFIEFIRANGVNNVPEPIISDHENNWSLFSWLEGNKVKKPSKGDYSQIIDFLVKLRKISNKDKSNAIPIASEACFSYKSHYSHTKERLENLIDTLSLHESSGKYLSADFLKILYKLRHEMKEIENLCIDQLKLGQWSETIGLNLKSLSQSDIGFHNIIKKDGKLYFFDFEYSGWDDSSKLLSDLVLQPDTPIPIFEPYLYEKFEIEKTFTRRSLKRLRIMLLIYRIKWLIIMIKRLSFLRDNNQIEQLFKKSQDYLFHSEIRIEETQSFLEKI